MRARWDFLAEHHNVPTLAQLVTTHRARLDAEAKCRGVRLSDHLAWVLREHTREAH